MRPTPPTKSSLTETRQLWLDFWTLFDARLAATPGHSLARRKPQPKHWLNWGLGNGNCFLGVRGRIDEGWLAVNLWIDTGDAAASWALFEALEAQCAAIESELRLVAGERLEWHRKEHARSSEILLRHDWNLADRNSWPDALDWLAHRTLDFHHVLADRVQPKCPSAVPST